MIESAGVKTKIERGNRVFPESDKSSDVNLGIKQNDERRWCKCSFE